MKKITIVIFLFTLLSAFAQNEIVSKEDFQNGIKPLIEKIKSIQSENGILKKEIGTLNSKLSKTAVMFDSLLLKQKSLQSQTESNSRAIAQTNNELGIKIKETGDKSDGKITAVSESLSKNSLYAIIGVLSAMLLSALLYWLLSKKQKTDKTDFIDQLSKTKSSIEESLVKEFEKQTELMDSQLHSIEQQKSTLQETPNVEPDHSLALKVADQIVAIERSIGLMDEKTKGLQRIKNSITNLKDNLSANSYELPDLIGKPFNQGMKIIIASSIPDENLKKGEEIITRIVKPQVNFNDKMIQAAQVEVSIGY
jgi:hypothetical protein